MLFDIDRPLDSDGDNHSSRKKKRRRKNSASDSKAQHDMSREEGVSVSKSSVRVKVSKFWESDEKGSECK